MPQMWEDVVDVPATVSSVQGLVVPAGRVSEVDVPSLAVGLIPQARAQQCWFQVLMFLSLHSMNECSNVLFNIPVAEGLPVPPERVSERIVATGADAPIAKVLILQQRTAAMFSCSGSWTSF